MRRVLKWVVRGAVAVLVAAFFAVWAGYFLLRNTETPVSGRIAVPGLSASATITRDREGVPHITGATPEDVHFALGFTHAQDRLWQMELQRRAVAGRLSEVFGNRTLPSDIFMRTMDLYGHAARSLAAFKPEARAQVEAYAAGVNAYLQRRTGLIEPRYPIEFIALGHTPEPWTAADCVAIVKLMALNLSTNVGLETLRLAFAAQGLTSAEIADLLPHDRRCRRRRFRSWARSIPCARVPANRPPPCRSSIR